MLYQRLRERQERGAVIQVGLIGAGTFGTQIASQVSAAPGMRLAAIAEVRPERARRACQRAGLADDRVATASDPEAVDEAIAAGTCAITRADALLDSAVDIVVEATGSVEAGAAHARAAIAAGKPVVMVTVEADVVVGPYLKRLADRAGVLYGAAYGDEPALALELWDWARALGFRVVAAGKGTRFAPSMRKANPDDVPRLYGFTGRDYNPQMFGSFLDGTKHAIEMCALANMSGLVPDVRGMHFPCADLHHIPDVLCHHSKGGVLAQEGVVEAVSSVDADLRPVERHLRGGLFCVVDGPSPYTGESLASYGDIIGMVIGQRSGYAMVYRPQHWVGHEMPISIARMMVLGDTCGHPVGHVAEVVCAAKKPLPAGTRLDGEGGYCVYGLLDEAEAARREHLLPVGLSQGAVLIRDIPEDRLITYEDVELPDSEVMRLRALQDQTFH